MHPVSQYTVARYTEIYRQVLIYLLTPELQRGPDIRGYRSWFTTPGYRLLLHYFNLATSFFLSDPACNIRRVIPGLVTPGL